MMNSMGRGNSTHAHRAPTRSRRRELASGSSAATTSPSLDVAADIAAIDAQVAADTHKLIAAALDESDRGDATRALSRSVAVERDGENIGAPNHLIQAAYLAHTIGQADRAQDYLRRARTETASYLEGMSPAAGEWEMSSSTGAKRAVARWMADSIETYLTDEDALTAAAAAAMASHDLFGRKVRHVQALSERASAVALEHRDADAHTLALEMVRIKGDAELAAQVAAFDPERIANLGRVTRAAQHRPEWALHNSGVLADIAGDGRLWRLVRLEALTGREAEREHMRLHDRPPARAYRDGGAARHDVRTGAGLLRRVFHTLALRSECGLELNVTDELRDEGMTMDALNVLRTRPGRTRTRALVETSLLGTDVRLAYEVLYEGIDENTGAPISASLRWYMGRSRQTKPESQLKRLRDAFLPDRFPLEPGLWTAFHHEPATQVLAGPDVEAPPRVPFGALVPPADPCRHRDGSWAWQPSGMAKLSCVECGDELMRRPATSVDALLPKDARERKRAAEKVLPQVQALACLVGRPVPASARALLAAPRCDDWRAEIARERAAARPARKLRPIAS